MTQKADHSIHLALSEDRADIYFARTQTVLQKEGLDPSVTMEIFDPFSFQTEHFSWLGSGRDRQDLIFLESGNFHIRAKSSLCKG